MALDAAFHFLFSIQGRVSRLQFRLCRLAFYGAYYAFSRIAIQASADSHAAIASANPSANFGLPLFELAVVLLAFILTFWISIVITVKRWHDQDKSGWWALLGFVPVIGWLWQNIQCAIMPGTAGPNQYGPPTRLGRQ